MLYIKGLENYHNTNPTAITLGKFDGLHQGHELLIERIIYHQKEHQVDSVVVTFDMLKDENIMSNQQKADKLSNRIDYFIECPFVESIFKMTAEDFIREIIVAKLHARYIVVGSDFCFGYQRLGNTELLKEYGKIYGYDVEVIEKKQYDGQEISSTLIRNELKKGNFELADKLLGYSYQELKK